ncbi:MAG: TolC family protein [Flavobacteriales bacterium]|nr:TolC family protein [Flavobacteriales bacterium]
MTRYLTFLSLIFLCFAGNNLFYAQNTLDYYLQNSQQNNPNLKDFSSQINVTAIDSLKARRDFGFKVDGIADASYSPQFSGYGYDGNTTVNGRNLTLIGRVSKEILSKRNFNIKLNSFSIAVQQLLDQKNLSALNLKRAISQQYLLAYESQEQYKIDQEIIHIFEQEDMVLKKLTQKSVFRQTDYLTFKVTQQQSELLQKQHYADFQNNFGLLQYLSGLQNQPEMDLVPPDFYTKIETQFDESIYAKTFRTDSLKLENDIDLVNYNYRPKISIYADGGYSSALIQTPYKNFGASAGVTLNIPIYDGHQRQLSIEQKKIEFNTRKKYVDFYQKQFQQQKEQIKNQILQYREMVNLATTQMKYSKTLIEANLKQLPTGDVRMVDFILAITNYTTLKSGLLTYKIQLLKLDNQYENIILP